MPRNKFFLIKLKTLKKQHLIVSDAVKLLNIIFSLQLLSIIAMTFLSTTFEMYFYVQVRWQDGISISFNWHFLNTARLIARLFWITRLILLVWVCETSKNQAREIATTIHEVLNRTSDEQIKNEVIKKTLSINYFFKYTQYLKKSNLNKIASFTQILCFFYIKLF